MDGPMGLNPWTHSWQMDAVCGIRLMARRLAALTGLALCRCGPTARTIHLRANPAGVVATVCYSGSAGHPTHDLPGHKLLICLSINS